MTQTGYNSRFALKCSAIASRFNYQNIFYTKAIYSYSAFLLTIIFNYISIHMNTVTKQKNIKHIRITLTAFIILLLLSGITAFPIETELAALMHFKSLLPVTMQSWLTTIHEAVASTNKAYPYLSYGTDWLAFAHIVIAVVFIGPFKDPVKNIWVIEFGMIACVMVFPLAFIAGPIRGIPFYWQLIDCSFGIFGFIPLFVCHRKIKILEKETFIIHNS